MSILENLFKVLLSGVISLFNLIINPIYSIISDLLPFAFSDFIDSINNLINAFISFVPFIADLTFLPSFIIKMIVNYLIFKYTVKFGVFAIKLVVKWWNFLKG